MVGTRRSQGAQKRQRLVESARQMIYHQGVERTTLADVATEADVAVGNIFYYFKTKNELVDAIVEGYCEAGDEQLARLDRRRTPRTRLKAFVDEVDTTADSLSQYGCPIGTLASELNKRWGLKRPPAARTCWVRWSTGPSGNSGRWDNPTRAIWRSH